MFWPVCREKSLSPWLLLHLFPNHFKVTKQKKERLERETERESGCERESLRADSRESVNNMLNIWRVPLQPDQLIAIPVTWWPAGRRALGLLLWNKAHFSLRHTAKTLQQLLTLKTNCRSFIQQTGRWGQWVLHDILPFTAWLIFSHQMASLCLSTFV